MLSGATTSRKISLKSTHTQSRKSSESRLESSMSSHPAPAHAVVPGERKEGSQARITCDPTVVTGPPLSDFRVHRGIDFLKVSFWLDWEGSAILERLEAQKVALQDTEFEESIPLHLYGLDWNLSRTGVRFFSYRLQGGDVVLLLSPRGSKGNMPSARLEIGSLTSQSELPLTLEGIRHFFTEAGVTIVKEQVSEVHLAADFIGLSIKELNLDNIDRWISRARDFIPNYQHWHFTGCSLGKGNIMLRCYDKVLELKRSIHKQDVFAELWGCSSYDEYPVTRVEYQLRRPVLRDFRGIDCMNGMNTSDELLSALSSLWRYCTQDWSKFMATVVDRDNKNHQRSVLSEFWEAVRGVVWTNAFECVRNKKTPNKDIESLRKQVRGGMMSVISFFIQDIYDFDEINRLAKKLIEEDLKAFQKDEDEFLKRMMKKRNEAVFDTCPF